MHLLGDVRALARFSHLPLAHLHVDFLCLKNAHVHTTSLVLAHNAFVDILRAPDDRRVDDALNDAGDVEFRSRFERQLECCCAPALMFCVENVAVDRIV